MSKIINAHNSKIANKEGTESDQILCNCRNRNDCPIDGTCLSFERRVVPYYISWSVFISRPR